MDGDDAVADEDTAAADDRAAVDLDQPAGADQSAATDNRAAGDLDQPEAAGEQRAGATENEPAADPDEAAAIRHNLAVGQDTADAATADGDVQGETVGIDLDLAAGKNRAAAVGAGGQHEFGNAAADVVRSDMARENPHRGASLEHHTACVLTVADQRQRATA